MAFFQRLQDSAFTAWFLGSESIWTYPTVLTLHTVGMAMLVGASFVINLRVLQVAGVIPLPHLRPLYRFIWIGFAINLASGVVLFVQRHAIEPRDAPQVATGRSRTLAAASLLAWVIAIVAGRLMAYL